MFSRRSVFALLVAPVVSLSACSGSSPGACGAAGQPCCDNAACGAALVCESGKCVAAATGGSGGGSTTASTAGGSTGGPSTSGSASSGGSSTGRGSTGTSAAASSTGSSGSSTTGSGSSGGSSTGGGTGSGTTGTASTSGGAGTSGTTGAPPRCTVRLPSVPWPSLGGKPFFTTLADVDRDGHLDVVAVNAAFPAGASVLLGRGDGTFAAALTDSSLSSLGEGADAAVVGDFDGDGKPDLAVHSNNDVDVVLGAGNGTFGPSHETFVAPPSGTYQVSALAAGDFDHDGHLDVAILGNDFQTGGGFIQVVLGKGDGTFNASAGAAFSTSSVGTYPKQVVVGDLNGDGKLDLAVANSGSGTVGVLLGNGDGTFAGQVSYAAGTETVSIAEGDFDGNGTVDLATAGASDTLNVLLGVGDGTFQGAVSYQGTDVWNVNATLTSVAAAPRSPGGPVDIYASDNLNTLQLFRGKGDGTFAAAIAYAAGDQPASLAAGDLNGDGVADLIAASTGQPDATDLGSAEADVAVLLGNGDGTFAAAAANPAILFGPIASSDFNGDGKVDLLTGLYWDSTNRPTTSASVTLGLGDGGFLAPTPAIGVDPIWQSALLVTVPPVVGDFNGDGKADVLLFDASDWYAGLGQQSFFAALGRGNGTFDGGLPQVDAGSISFPPVVAAAAGDFNGDGRLDVAAVESANGEVEVALGNGDGTFGAVSVMAVPAGPAAVTTGDFDGDGHLDVAVVSATAANASVLLGNGDGTFRAPVSAGVGKNPGSIAAGDFDGDGHLDLAVGNAGAGTITVLLGRGTGAFKVGTDVGAGGIPADLAVADLDGDGHADLIASDGVSLAVLLGNGDGTFQPVVHYGLPGPFTIADFDGDHRLDIASQGPSTYVALNGGCH